MTSNSLEFGQVAAEEIIISLWGSEFTPLGFCTATKSKFLSDLALLVEDIYRVLYYNKVKMEDDFVAVLTSMLAVETIGKKLIGKNQNLFHAIGKHFAMQSDAERV